MNVIHGEEYLELLRRIAIDLYKNHNHNHRDKYRRSRYRKRTLKIRDNYGFLTCKDQNSLTIGRTIYCGRI